MKKIYNILIAATLAITVIACEPYPTPSPQLDDFKLFQLTTDVTGSLVTGNEITSPKAGETVRIVMLTTADMAVVWTGDYTYRPWGATDSLLNSHDYEHYGMLGAEGFTTNVMDGRVGYFKDFAWPEAGSYPVTVVLTNHGVAGPDFNQNLFDFTVDVSN